MNWPLAPWESIPRIRGCVGSAALTFEMPTVRDALPDLSIMLKWVFQGSFFARTWARMVSRVSFVSPTPGCLKPFASIDSLMTGW
jgi:hypothetical protein